VANEKKNTSIEKGTKTKRFGQKKKKKYIHFWGGKGITKSLGVPGGSVFEVWD